MGITLDEARRIVEEMIKKTGENLIITNMMEVYDSEDEFNNIYVYSLKNVDSGRCYHPGERLPTIRKGDGALVDFTIVPPGC